MACKAEGSRQKLVVVLTGGVVQFNLYVPSATGGGVPVPSGECSGVLSRLVSRPS